MNTNIDSGSIRLLPLYPLYVYPELAPVALHYLANLQTIYMLGFVLALNYLADLLALVMPADNLHLVILTNWH